MFHWAIVWGGFSSIIAVRGVPVAEERFEGAILYGCEGEEGGYSAILTRFKLLWYPTSAPSFIAAGAIGSFHLRLGLITIAQPTLYNVPIGTGIPAVVVAVAVHNK